jgi:hypothetical protein
VLRDFCIELVRRRSEGVCTCIYTHSGWFPSCEEGGLKMEDIHICNEIPPFVETPVLYHIEK